MDMVTKKPSSRIVEILKTNKEKQDVRVTTYIEAELHDVVMKLKSEGIAVKKLFNEALRNFLEEHNQI